MHYRALSCIIGNYRALSCIIGKVDICNIRYLQSKSEII